MSDEYQLRVLKVLADPTRYRIVQLTSDGPKHPKNLAKLLGMTSSAVYQHLNALLEVGFIERVEVENRVHYRAREGVPEFLQRLGEACERLGEGGGEAAPRPIVESPPLRGTSMDESRVQGGIWGSLKSSFFKYYAHSPFWSIVVAVVCLIDALLAVWCLFYALFYSSNPVLTVIGGVVICGLLGALANYLYRRTKPICSSGVAEE